MSRLGAAAAAALCAVPQCLLLPPANVREEANIQAEGRPLKAWAVCGRETQLGQWEHRGNVCPQSQSHLCRSLAPQGRTNKEGDQKKDTKRAKPFPSVFLLSLEKRRISVTWLEDRLRLFRGGQFIGRRQNPFPWELDCRCLQLPADE